MTRCISLFICTSVICVLKYFKKEFGFRDNKKYKLQITAKNVIHQIVFPTDWQWSYSKDRGIARVGVCICPLNICWRIYWFFNLKLSIIITYYYFNISITFNYPPLFFFVHLQSISYVPCFSPQFSFPHTPTPLAFSQRKKAMKKTLLHWSKNKIFNVILRIWQGKARIYWRVIALYCIYSSVEDETRYDARWLGLLSVSQNQCKLLLTLSKTVNSKLLCTIQSATTGQCWAGVKNFTVLILRLNSYCNHLLLCISYCIKCWSQADKIPL